MATQNGNQPWARSRAEKGRGESGRPRRSYRQGRSHWELPLRAVKRGSVWGHYFKHWKRILGTDAHRGRQFSGSPDSPDVITGVPGVHFEVKRVEQFRLYAALDQAVGDAGDKVPVVLHRTNRRPWVAIVRLDDLPRLAEQVFLTLAENN